MTIAVILQRFYTGGHTLASPFYTFLLGGYWDNGGKMNADWVIPTAYVMPLDFTAEHIIQGNGGRIAIRALPPQEISIELTGDTSFGQSSLGPSLDLIQEHMEQLRLDAFEAGGYWA